MPACLKRAPWVTGVEALSAACPDLQSKVYRWSSSLTCFREGSLESRSSSVITGVIGVRLALDRIYTVEEYISDVWCFGVELIKRRRSRLA